jgi:hypothetical protein
MIRYKEIAFMAYPVTDVARARKFYEGALGLKPNAPLKSESQMWIEYDQKTGWKLRWRGFRAVFILHLARFSRITFGSCSREMRSVPDATCFFAQSYKALR